MTILTPERIAELHVAGAEQASRSRFVDPVACSQAESVLHTRGEMWAASILLRNLTRRSLIRADLPWISEAEMYTLIYADRAEWQAMEHALTTD